MGTKTLLKVAIPLLGGLLLCGCESPQRNTIKPLQPPPSWPPATSTPGNPTTPTGFNGNTGSFNKPSPQGIPMQPLSSATPSNTQNWPTSNVASQGGFGGNTTATSGGFSGSATTSPNAATTSGGFSGNAMTSTTQGNFAPPPVSSSGPGLPATSGGWGTPTPPAPITPRPLSGSN
jgi:hypothetical protein